MLFEVKELLWQLTVEGKYYICNQFYIFSKYLTLHSPYSEGKKICKQWKIKPEPSVIKHYKDGEYHKDYDRKER